MNDNQLLRYSRHILLEEIGIEGEPTKAQAPAVVAKDAPVKPTRKAKG